MRKTLKLAVLPLFLTVIAGCSGAPDVEENNATQAMSAAAQVHAARYAPTEWQMAEDTLQAAKAEKAAQEGRFAFFRNYGEAKALFERTTVLANQAKATAEPEFARARRETEMILSQARSALDSVTAKLLSIRAGKGARADVEAMKQDAAALQQQLNQAQADFDRAEYDSARTKAQTIIDKVSAMKVGVKTTPRDGRKSLRV